MQTTRKPFDFATVERTRKHMLLTKGDMARLLGVSRVTYHAWENGSQLRPSNESAVRSMLKRLLAVITQHQWPTPEVLAAPQKLRFARLKELLDEQ